MVGFYEGFKSTLIDKRRSKFMDGTLVIVGGYWRASAGLLRQVDRDSAPEDRAVDYVIRFKNLPDKFLAVEQIPVVKYDCTICGKPVPEWEVENKIGCFVNHKLARRVEMKPNYESGKIDRVPESLGKKKPMIKDAYRLHFSNPHGQNMIEEIFEYVKKVYKIGETVPSPIATGTKTGWAIADVNEIPVWELPIIKDEVEEKKVVVDEDTKEEVKMTTCPHCDAPIKDKKMAIRMHIMKKHPEIFKDKYAKDKNTAELTA